MDTIGKNSTVWATIGKISVLIAAIAGLLTIFSYFNNDSPYIVAECDKFSIKKSLLINSIDEKTLNTLIKEASAYETIEFCSSLGDKNPSKDSINGHQATREAYFRSILSPNQDREYLCIRCTLKNFGKSEASGITISASNGLKKAFINEDEYNLKGEKKKNKTIEIDRLRPDEMANIVMWLEGYYSSEIRQFKIISKNGSAKIYFPYQVKGFLGEFLNNYMLHIIFILLIVIALAMAIIATILEQREKKQKALVQQPPDS